ncbi:putative transposase, partial [Tremellales sp. Uapishka_1]
MIDSGATNSFIDQAFLDTTNVSSVLKDTPIDLQVIDGRPISSGAITQHTSPLKLSVSGHEETISLDITSLGSYPVILGLPWLSRHNPSIDWTKPSIVFSSQHCLEQCLWPDQPKGRDSASPVLPDLVGRHASSNSSSQDEQRCSLTSSNSEPQSTTALGTLPSSEAPLKISLVSAAAFRSALKTATVYGITNSQFSNSVYHPSPAQWDDDSDPDISTLRSSVPVEFHGFLDVFRKSNSDKLPEYGKYDHSIPLEGTSQPPFGPIYSLSEVELKALDEYLKDNLKKGFIQPSSSPAGSPILFVKKSDGSLRLCVDYRGLNKITRKNRYPLPLIQESLDRLKEATWFSKVDLRAAYNLIRIAKGDEWKTAFRTRYGLFEYLVMPFGLTNAPASFQYLINDVLRDFLDIFVIVYLDDILIFSNTREEHVNHVNQVLQRLKDNSLWANAEKCRFFQHEVDFLGYLVSDTGIRMDPKKISAVTDWPIPKSVHDIQVFLGFANFYRRFIRSYSKITTPLTRLLRKDVKFEWGDEETQSFKTLKEAFTSAPILQHFQPGRPLTIETDASDFAIAGILSHSDENNQLRPVAYYSRKLQPAELNYEIYDKEMLAIVEAFKIWRPYLEGAQGVSVFTDHKNLEYFTTSKVLNRRQARWGEILAHFDFKITFRPGTSMGKPDALSRRQDLQGGSKAANAPPHTLLKPGQFVIGALEHPSEDPNSNPVSDVFQRIKQLQSEDPVLQDLLPYLIDPNRLRTPDLEEELKPFSLHDKVVHFGNLVYVPNNQELKLDLLQQTHNLASHLGQAKTHDLVARQFYFPGLRQFVNTYVSGCHTCMRNKIPRHKPYGPLQPLPIPSGPWRSLSMDAIVKLPLSNGFDCIQVFVDRFTKQAHFVPYKEEGFGSIQLAQMFQDQVFRLHGIPHDIISDRGPIFNSHFWRSFLASLKIKPNFSTAFHPQSDGQTERVNQVLETYLRTHCDYDQSNWSSLLSLAEFTYNNSVHATTKFSPFEANYGYHPLDPSSLALSNDSVPAVQQHLDRLHSAHQALIENIKKAQITHAKFYNKRVKAIDSSDTPTFKIGDMVFLNRKNIITARPSLKLDQRMLGPFKIIEATPSPLAFKLDLPPSMKVHPVFHVNLLEPARSGIPNQVQDPPPRIEVNGQEEWIIERILDSSRSEDNDYIYLVKWLDFPQSDNSWEPWDNVHNTGPFKTFYRQNKNNPAHHFPLSRASRTKPKKQKH